MESIKIATAQFENHNGDKAYNLSIIENLTATAKSQGAQAISFHEMCITGYTFLKDLSKDKIVKLSEKIPEGKSLEELKRISGKYGVTILAGLLEIDENRNLFNTYVCVNNTGLLAKYRKLHPFISQHLSPGNQYLVFDLNGWKCGILICYDNNIIENVRATALLGADIIFAPHVTMCTPSPIPGSGYVDKKLWENRVKEPATLRREFDGPKGKEWLMRWLPARAYDNGVYVVFSNPIGMEGDQIKNGNSLILDPFGDIIAEIKSFDNQITVGLCTPEKLTLAGGFRYRNARRPDLYGKILSEKNIGKTHPFWLSENKKNE
ncbi:MAG: nitrilase family protein [Bacteroidetes bacterium]|nr:nitrilase family protein [Bacteroidota bacterium]